MTPYNVAYAKTKKTPTERKVILKLKPTKAKKK